MIGLESPSIPVQSETATTTTAPRSTVLLLAALLFVSVFCLFLPSIHCDFVNYDDDVYVTDNIHAREGLRWDNVAWAFGGLHVGFYHPLTMLSHSMACEVFGMQPWGHHLINVFLHALNALLVFVLLRSMTASTWRSFFVASLFGVHPLRVESVAWIAERKDVLSVCFWILTLIFYVRYTRTKEENLSKSTWNYTLAFVCFAAALLSKPLVVTVPFVLLLLDYWPLQRVSPPRIPGKNILLEKVPFLLVAVGASAITVFGHEKAGVLHMTTKLPLLARFDNALVSYCRYLGKLFVPVNLAVLYPHPGDWPVVQVLMAVVILIAISVFVITQRTSRPYLAFGWFLFCGALVPAIGLLQAGVQAMADRYTYVPSLGIFIFLTWGISDVTQRWRHRQVVLGTSGLAAIIGFSAITTHQLRYWTDSETLFRHALAVTERNAVMHHALAEVLEADPGRLPEAIHEYETALQIDPANAATRNNLGAALEKDPQRHGEAMAQYEQALYLDPKNPLTHNNIAIVLVKAGRFSEAVSHFEEALRIDPNDAPTHCNLGLTLLNIHGREQEAITQFEETLRLDPNWPPAVQALQQLGVIQTQSQPQLR